MSFVNRISLPQITLPFCLKFFELMITQQNCIRIQI
ncbi:hypothetical protein pb186bvf_018019 [Paramecium bursaria]